MIDELTTIAERNARLKANGFDLAKALKRRVTWVRNGFYPDPALDQAPPERIPMEQEQRTRYDDGMFTRD